MLLSGINHVATLTGDTERLHAFYRDVFESEIITDMKAKDRRPVDYFKMFFADTAINGSKSGTQCGIDFFGCEHVLFGTDCPFDPEGGPLFIREIIKTLDELGLDPDQRKMIYSDNAEKLLRLSAPNGQHYKKK